MDDDIDVGALFGLLAVDLRTRAAKSLLAGNDTQCFTTDEYKTAYDRVVGHPCVLGWDYDGDLARRHLLSIPRVVREVAPGVWAAADRISVTDRGNR